MHYSFLKQIYCIVYIAVTRPRVLGVQLPETQNRSLFDSAVSRASGQRVTSLCIIHMYMCSWTVDVYERAHGQRMAEVEERHWLPLHHTHVSTGRAARGSTEWEYEWDSEQQQVNNDCVFALTFAKPPNCCTKSD